MNDVEARLIGALGGWAAASIAVGAVLAALDLGYLAAGAWIVRDGWWRGDGQGVLVQGAFLLLLDTAAAARLR